MSWYQLPVVIDNGSEVIKAGLAGSREPQFMYPNITGRSKGQSWAQGAQELWVGDQAEDRRSSLSIRYRLFLGGRTRGRGRGRAQSRGASGSQKARKPLAGLLGNAGATTLPDTKHLTSEYYLLSGSVQVDADIHM